MAGLHRSPAAAIEYTERFTADHQALDDEFYERLRASYSDEEVLDLTLCLAIWLGLGRTLAVLQVEQRTGWPTSDVVDGSLRDARSPPRRSPAPPRAELLVPVAERTAAARPHLQGGAGTGGRGSPIRSAVEALVERGEAPMGGGPGVTVEGSRTIRGQDLTVHRLGSAPCASPAVACGRATRLRRGQGRAGAVELGVDFIDTADSYGPEVSEG